MEIELTLEDQARLIDSKHQIQSADDSLSHVDPRKMPDVKGIRRCLQDADKTIREALRVLRNRLQKDKTDKLV